MILSYFSALNVRLRGDNTASTHELRKTGTNHAPSACVIEGMNSLLESKLDVLLPSERESECWLWYLRWSQVHADPPRSLQMAEIEQGWRRMGIGGNPEQVVIANGCSALLPTVQRGGRAWLPGPRGSRNPQQPAANLLLARLDRGSWTEEECDEMHAAGVRLYALDAGGFVSLNDPVVRLLFRLFRTARSAHGVYIHWNH